MRNWRILGLLFCLLLFTQGCTTFNIEDVEAFIGASIPTTASNVEFKTEKGIDRIVWIKFIVPNEDADTFISDLGIAEPLQDSYDPRFSIEQANNWWWSDDEQNSFRGAEGWINGRAYGLVIVEYSSTHRYIYLEVFSL